MVTNLQKTVKIGNVVARDDSVNIFLSFTNKSKSDINLSELFEKYLMVTTDTGQAGSVRLATDDILIDKQVTVAEASTAGVHIDGKSLEITLK